MNKTSVAALCAMVALAMGHPAHAAATVLDFNDLAQPGTGRKFIPQNDFKYEGFNFNSNYSTSPNFFTLGTDDPANADKEGATFGHNWSGWDLYISRADGGFFDLFSMDVADIFNIGARHSGHVRLVFADNQQSVVDFATDSATGLETLVFDVKNLKGFFFHTDAGENMQIDNIRLTGTAAVPEPATWAMLILGFGGAGAVLRRRRSLALA